MSRTATDPDPAPTSSSRNDVALRGVLAVPPELRELASGDTLLVLKLTVRRQPPTSRPARPREPRQDTLTCITYAKALITRSATWQPGDVLDVEGALRRRVWRSPTGAAVAHEVECHRVRKVRVPGARGVVGDAGPA
ncbi:single-stranded DNA-binding protein [Klenkia soli]|nr:single-stranded DNA-binding protein [Klenkia soli]